MKRYILPLSGFALLLVLLGVGLRLKPQEIPSPLIGKRAPEITLPQVEDVSDTTVEQNQALHYTERDLLSTQLHGTHNDTVVVDSRIGEPNNHLTSVLDRYGIRREFLNDPGQDWLHYEPKGKMLVLNEVYPEGLMIPKSLIGANIIHLPTLKTHVFTEMTGAMKNAFGGLLHLKRHWTHSVIHETLVDLLTIQKEIHPGIFAVMDGTISGDGPGPREIATDRAPMPPDRRDRSFQERGRRPGSPRCHSDCRGTRERRCALCAPESRTCP